MTLATKDYSWCPLKKRPLPVPSPASFSNAIRAYEVDENEEPQDLSLKTRQRLRDYPPCSPQNTFTKKQLIPKHLVCNLPPSRTPSVISYGSSEIKPLPVSTDGLRLISEVASRVSGLQSVEASRMTPNTIHQKKYYAPLTPRSPARIALKERGSWSSSYHPYMPLSLYSLPPTSYALTVTPSSAARDQIRPRSGSASPPGGISTEASSSGSESSSPDNKGDRLSCADCGRGYATLAGLTRHQQFHCLKDANQTFSCQHCSKSYTSVGALKMHIRTHTLPCKCHVCGKAFSRPWLLQGHIRTHTGEKPFECNECHRSFADRSNLRAHQQTHADVKKYACPKCPKTFSRISLLVKHQDHGCPGLLHSRPFSVVAISSSAL